TGSLGERPGNFVANGKSRPRGNQERWPPQVMPSHNSSNDGPRGIREAALAALAGQVLPAHRLPPATRRQRVTFNGSKVRAPGMPYSMLDEAMIVQAYADDPASAESEWFGAFRSGLESLLADDVIDAAIDHD